MMSMPRRLDPQSPSIEYMASRSDGNMQRNNFEMRPYRVGTYEVGSTLGSNRQSHVALTFATLACGFLWLSLNVAAIIWLWVSGPQEVPGQDTRITAIIISVGKVMASLFLGIAFARAAWGSFIPQLVHGSRFSARTLLAVCHQWNSLGQWQDFRALPTAFRIFVLLGGLACVGMMGTSSTFRYTSRDVFATGAALVPNFAYACNTSLIELPNYVCQAQTSPNTTDVNTSFNLNGNTTRTSWKYIEQVNSGGRGTVTRTGTIGDDALGANVTLAVLPIGGYLKEGHRLPWLAMSVSCRSLSIEAVFVGSGLLANATIIVNGSVIDTLDISQMPQWNGVVHMYQHWNDSGPLSSLSPWTIVMLTRDVNDGTAHFDGLADDAAGFIGNTFVDLHGYAQPELQGILGAAAYCEFEGSAGGGGWPNDVWPPRGQTTNFVAGEMIGDRPTMATGVLNYGPSWQYSPVSESFLDEGSVSYIANNTGPGVSFPDLFASYIRNQWALMAYSMSPQCSQHIEAVFEGTTSSRLFIGVTVVALAPLSALVLGLFVSIIALFVTLRQRYWVQRIDFEGWWLFKTLRLDLMDIESGDATRKELQTTYNALKVSFDPITGQLVFPE